MPVFGIENLAYRISFMQFPLSWLFTFCQYKFKEFTFIAERYSVEVLHLDVPIPFIEIKVATLPFHFSTLEINGL